MYRLNQKTIIAIDGGAGVGKTTVSKNLSKILNILYIDTGAMYRAYTLYFLNNNIELTDENIINHLKDINVELKMVDQSNVVYLNGKDVTSLIRTEEVSVATSIVAKNKILREKMVKKQREMAGDKSIVIEGRDTTTVVFPNADIKLFLTSNIDTRAKRRYNDLLDMEKGEILLQNVKDDMIKRDISDASRKDSPLVKADDAIEIDTSNFDIETTTRVILDILNKKGRLVIDD